MPNRVTAAMLAAIAENGITPLEYLLGVMLDESQDVCARINTAKAAAPFAHRKLAAVEVNSQEGNVVLVHDWRGGRPD
jgi:hypothetical protein